uniref:Uncharacterized protein n=1 Tax=Arundo donax TaxID=35708 RepID=A0A0A9AQG1_ARUDO
MIAKICKTMLPWSLLISHALLSNSRPNWLNQKGENKQISTSEH